MGTIWVSFLWTYSNHTISYAGITSVSKIFMQASLQYLKIIVYYSGGEFCASADWLRTPVWLWGSIFIVHVSIVIHRGLISCPLILYHFRLLEELGHRSDCNGAQAMKFLQGLVLAINCTAETPMFLYSGKKL